MRGVWVSMNQERSARVQLFAVTAREEEDQVGVDGDDLMKEYVEDQEARDAASGAEEHSQQSSWT